MSPVAILGSNSMASNSTGTPSSKTILPRCRSPWPRATRPARSRAASSARTRPNAPRVGAHVVDPPRLGQMIERLRLVETPHLHRPFYRLTLTADGEHAVFRARDRHRAAVDCRRIGMIDLELGHAGGLAFGQGG